VSSIATVLLGAMGFIVFGEGIGVFIIFWGGERGIHCFDTGR